MKNVERIAQTLKSVFGVLTHNIATFSNIYGYETAQITIKGVNLGIGIKVNFTELRFYTIRTIHGYNDPRRFKETFVIKPIFLNKTWGWNIELISGNLVSNFEKFSTLSGHLSAISEVSIMIEEYSNSY